VNPWLAILTVLPLPATPLARLRVCSWCTYEDMAFQALTGHVNKFVLLTNVTSSRTTMVCTCQDIGLPQQLHFKKKSNINLQIISLYLNPIYDLIRGDLCAHFLTGFSQYMFTECNEKQIGLEGKIGKNLAKTWVEWSENQRLCKSNTWWSAGHLCPGLEQL